MDANAELKRLVQRYKAWKKSFKVGWRCGFVFGRAVLCRAAHLGAPPAVAGCGHACSLSFSHVHSGRIPKSEPLSLPPHPPRTQSRISATQAAVKHAKRDPSRLAVSSSLGHTPQSGQGTPASTGRAGQSGGEGGRLTSRLFGNLKSARTSSGLGR